MKLIANFIGSIIRDIVLQFSSEYAMYIVVEDYYVYKSWIPFIVHIGDYYFIPSRIYNKFITDDIIESKR